MKTFKINERLCLKHTDMYQVAYEQMYEFENMVVVLKPYNLTYQQLQSTPIRIAFYNIYTFREVFAEFRLTRQTQIIELFQVLQRLNFSGNLIANILKVILNNWEDQFKNKDLELVTFPSTPGRFYNSVFKDKQEPSWKKGFIYPKF
ncbi:hypothetical protein ACXYW7_00070 [Mesomycoplasma ovipneumoniae]|uniref:hypothetical protein n=1 Tax=Mesomycoplasma ovipneumoniae TaxID=29562 RepID=UPI0028AE7504|nr:hypothetical protein [Mesomycoplasma ovipneumoniae]MDW2933188.1 hypothetical protein [Mesomycoplasma ovipneumoniae]WNM15596.1 hypothetical protein RNM12_02615 [Mesomycoplasma ovipneumoniae]